MGLFHLGYKDKELFCNYHFRGGFFYIESIEIGGGDTKRVHLM